VRRIAFILGGIGWSMVIAILAAAVRMSFEPLLLAVATGAVASTIAIAIATVSRSGFAPRIVLMILWYGYLSS